MGQLEGAASVTRRDTGAVCPPVGRGGITSFYVRKTAAPTSLYRVIIHLHVCHATCVWGVKEVVCVCVCSGGLLDVRHATCVEMRQVKVCACVQVVAAVVSVRRRREEGGRKHACSCILIFPNYKLQYLVSQGLQGQHHVRGTGRHAHSSIWLFSGLEYVTMHRDFCRRVVSKILGTILFSSL